MDSAPPEMGVGSWWHFQKKETKAKLEKFCRENNIRMESGYVYVITLCIAHCYYSFAFNIAGVAS